MLAHTVSQNAGSSRILVCGTGRPACVPSRISDFQSRISAISDFSLQNLNWSYLNFIFIFIFTYSLHLARTCLNNILLVVCLCPVPAFSYKRLAADLFSWMAVVGNVDFYKDKIVYRWLSYS